MLFLVFACSRNKIFLTIQWVERHYPNVLNKICLKLRLNHEKSVKISTFRFFVPPHVVLFVDCCFFLVSGSGSAHRPYITFAVLYVLFLAPSPCSMTLCHKLRIRKVQSGNSMDIVPY